MIIIDYLLGLKSLCLIFSYKLINHFVQQNLNEFYVDNLNVKGLMSFKGVII